MDEQQRFTRQEMKAMSNGAGQAKGTYMEVVLLAGQELPNVFTALTPNWTVSKQTTFYCITQTIIPRMLTGAEHASISKQKDEFVNVSSRVISL